MELEEYTDRHPQILSSELPPLLEDMVAHRRIGRVVDLGAGDGTLLWGLRGRAAEAVAVDLSPGRVERLRRLLPDVRAVVADACDTGLEAASAETVVCSQVIEHVPDDAALAAEIRRLLAPGGWFYIGTPLRRPHAFWLYRREGRWWLDPTHLREYESVTELTSLIEDAGLQVQTVRVSRCRYPLLDMILRLGVATRVVSPEWVGTFYANRADTGRLRRLRIQPPGYFLLEVVGTG